MTIQSNAELIALAKLEMGGSQDLLDDSQWDRVAEKAKQELGWSLPLSDSFKEFWLVERSRRHALVILMTEAAHKFKYKQLNLQQRHANYLATVKYLDEEFRKALEENPFSFSSAKPESFFGTYVGAGFSSDALGRDTTYTDGNLTDINPKE